jgi:hypothetical protein
VFLKFDTDNTVKKVNIGKDVTTGGVANTGGAPLKNSKHEKQEQKIS